MKRSTQEKATQLVNDIDQLKSLFETLNQAAEMTSRGVYADERDFNALRTAWADGMISSEKFAPIYLEAAILCAHRLKAKNAEFAALKDE